MSSFWQSYIEVIQILFDYLRSIWLGDSDLHQKVSELMLPWFHAYDGQNYARHFAYCWASRQQLPNTHPRLYTEFQQGKFSVGRSAGRFNKVPDQVIEQTISKDQKGSGGIIGYSTSESTVQRWIITSHVAARLLGDMENSLGIRASVSLTKDLGKSRKRV